TRDSVARLERARRVAYDSRRAIGRAATLQGHHAHLLEDPAEIAQHRFIEAGEGQRILYGREVDVARAASVHGPQQRAIDGHFLRGWLLRRFGAGGAALVQLVALQRQLDGRDAADGRP